MQVPTTSSRTGGRNRAHWVIEAVFTPGICVFGYGFATTVGLLPSGWGILAVFQFGLLLVGALLVTLVTIATLQVHQRDRQEPLTEKQAIRTSLIAAVIALIVVIVSWTIRVGSFIVPQFSGWILLGLVVLGLQFPLGTVRPKRKRRQLFLSETAFVFVFLFGFLTVDRGEIDFSSYLVVSGGATVLLLIFGSPLYFLGSILGSLPRPSE